MQKEDRYFFLLMTWHMNKNAMQNKKRHFFGSLIYCHCYSLTRQDKDNYIYLGFLLTGSNYRAERKKSAS